MYMKGKYYFLSNFYPCDVYYKEIHFKNAEAAFQSQKCIERMNEFTDLGALQAKRLGRKVPLRSDWEDIKIGIMYEVVIAKFSNQTLADMLIAVNEPLIEHNNHNDRFWGVCRGTGKNYLGNILYHVRSQIMVERGMVPMIPITANFSKIQEKEKRYMIVTNRTEE